jgi:hypothetical protein
LNLELNLTYFKRGDDLAHFLHTCDTTESALKTHAEFLEHNADVLRRASELIKDYEIHADTHYVGFEVEDEVGAELLKKHPDLFLHFDLGEEEEYEI